MTVEESSAFSFGNKAFTVLRMDETVPLTNWQKVIIGEKEYKPVFHSGLDSFSVCVDGSHKLNGKQVSFI